tara:strand:+ start:147 stop:395 length:249 start_codon:yes stop_codon:yes gene_type:complete
MLGGRMNTHDYSVREWGHNYSIIEIEGLQLRLTGWGRGISADDYIIIKNGDGTTRYKIDSIEYKRDPADMWFAEASFAPRDS